MRRRERLGQVDAVVIAPTSPLRGVVRVPGDKSISHRAVLFAAMASGSSQLTGVLDAADVRSSIAAVKAAGAVVGEVARGDGSLDVTIEGWGLEGPRPPAGSIDCGNSGTTARLLLGVLSASPFWFKLKGDASLSSRPMERVADPLRRMGARVSLSAAGTLPATVEGGELHAIRYESPVSSAQVKSAILLAGVGAEGRTVVIEPAPSRDHTERLLPAFGVGVGRSREERSCWLEGPVTLTASDVQVARDPSSAAFVMAAALMVADSEVSVPGVALNPTRLGFLRVLERMGARVEEVPTGACGAEPAGTITVGHGAGLRAVTVSAEEVPSLIDEIPVLAVVATQARGTTRLEGVGELRVKESDRLEAVTSGLRALGATVRSGPDWLEVDGPAALTGAALDSLGDHRLAMAWAVAGLSASSPVTVARWEAIDVSYPGFAADLETLAGVAVVLS